MRESLLQNFIEKADFFADQLVEKRELLVLLLDKVTIKSERTIADIDLQMNMDILKEWLEIPE